MQEIFNSNRPRRRGGKDHGSFKFTASVACARSNRAYGTIREISSRICTRNNRREIIYRRHRIPAVAVLEARLTVATHDRRRD